MLRLGQLQGDMMGHIGDGGGDDQLEEQHEVLQDDDQDDCLGPSDVGEDAVDGARETDQTTVNDDCNEAHDLQILEL